MYTVYQYAAGATQANVLADLVALITGETNKANLSADCVQAGTTIVSVEAAGWTVYDAAAGTNIQCLRALNQDGSTYKYWLLQFGTTTAFSHAIAEAWNAGAHTGTNVSAYTASTWSSTGGGVIRVYATPKNISILSYTTAYQTPTLLMCEMSRDTIASTYPCHTLCHAVSAIGSTSSAGCSMPRVKTANAAGDTLTTTGVYSGPVMAYSSATVLNSNTQIYRTPADVEQLAVYRLGFSGASAALGWQMYGSGYDIYVTTAAAAVFSNIDEISYGGKTYVAFKQGAGATILVPKE